MKINKENKNITINYKKEFANDGTVYNQTITISNEIMKMFIKFIYEKKKNISSKSFLYDEDLKILNVHIISNVPNYLTLTGLDLFMKFYLKYIYEPPKKDKTYERILNRNTILKVNNKKVLRTEPF